MTGDAIVAELPALLRYARALTGNDIDAEDLVQDTAVRALERAEGFRGESSLATWLHRILHHRFVDETRRRRPGLVDDEVLVAAVEAAWRDDDYTMDAPTVVQRAEDRDRLFDALAHLPAILRSAVVLHDMDGRTSAEVAQIHGIGLPAAKQRLRRGRALLLAVLAEDEERRKALRGIPMRCWQARARIGDYLDNELDQGQRHALETHLAACPTCPGLYAAVVGVTDVLGRLRDPDTVVPPALADRLHVALDRSGHQRRRVPAPTHGNG